MEPSARIPILVLVCIIVGSSTAAGQRRGSPPGSPPQRATGGATSVVHQPIERPLLGFVYDKDAGEARAILGVPGALVFSDPVELPAEATDVHFAPGQKYAIVERSDGSPLALLPLPGMNPGPLSEIPSTIIKPNIVSFSPNGTSVALYSSSEGRLQIVTGLPDSAQLLRDLTRDDLPDDVKLLAVSDRGSTLLEGTVNNAVYRLPFGASSEFVYSVTDLGGMTFAPASDDALLFDREGGTATLLQNVTGTASHVVIANQLKDFGGEIVLYLDTNNARIGSASARHLWQINLETLQLQDFQVPAPPKMLKQLRTSGKLLLSAESGEPAWILDTTGPTDTSYFVPAAFSTDSEPFSPAEPAGSKTGSKPIKKEQQDDQQRW